MAYQIIIQPFGKSLPASGGENLLSFLRKNGFPMDAPCGGNGSCGKCKVWIDGEEALACQTVIDRDMAVTIPHTETEQILTNGIMQPTEASCESGFCLAFDIGTATWRSFLSSSQLPKCHCAGGSHI